MTLMMRAGVGRAAAILGGEDLGQNAIAEAGNRRALPAALAEVDWRMSDGRGHALILRPFGRAADQFAVLVARGDVEHGDRRQGARAGSATCGVFCSMPSCSKLPQQALELDAAFRPSARKPWRSRAWRPCRGWSAMKRSRTSRGRHARHG